MMNTRSMTAKLNELKRKLQKCKTDLRTKIDDNLEQGIWGQTDYIDDVNYIYELEDEINKFVKI